MHTKTKNEMVVLNLRILNLNRNLEVKKEELSIKRSLLEDCGCGVNEEMSEVEEENYACELDDDITHLECEIEEMEEELEELEALKA